MRCTFIAVAATFAITRVRSSDATHESETISVNARSVLSSRRCATGMRRRRRRTALTPRTREHLGLLQTLADAMEKWFSYSYLANVLVPKPLVYLVRTHDGKYAKMHILSYYCANKSAGCLTFEYVYQGDGSHRLAGPSASGA